MSMSGGMWVMMGLMMGLMMGGVAFLGIREWLRRRRDGDHDSEDGS